jgi:hypothetical protein
MELVVFIIMVVTMIANVMSAYYARKSDLRGGSMESRNSPPLWRFYIVPVLSTLLVCGVVGFDYWDRHYPSRCDKDITKVGCILKSYGSLAHGSGEPWRVQAIVEGKCLFPYRDTHRVAVIAFHTPGDREWLDIRDLQKSALYDIRDGEIPVVFNLTDNYVNELAHGWRGATNYYPLLVPKGLGMDQFSTLRQALALGAIQLQGSTGPP